MQLANPYKISPRICEQLQNSLKILELLLGSVKSYSNVVGLCNAKWPEIETEIVYFEEQIHPAIMIENETYEGLETVVEWLETVEDIFTSMDRAESCELFKEAHSCFQVIFWLSRIQTVSILFTVNLLIVISSPEML